MTSAMVPTRAAAVRAAAAAGPVATAAESIVTSAVRAACSALEEKLASAYEELAEWRSDCDRYREHAEADHAALERVWRLQRAWGRDRLALGRDMSQAMRDALSYVCSELQAAIDGSQEGSHGEGQQGTAAGDTGTGRG